jgi:hypothetical protein
MGNDARARFRDPFNPSAVTESYLETSRTRFGGLVAVEDFRTEDGWGWRLSHPTVGLLCSWTEGQHALAWSHGYGQAADWLQHIFQCWAVRSLEPGLCFEDGGMGASIPSDADVRFPTLGDWIMDSRRGLGAAVGMLEVLQARMIYPAEFFSAQEAVTSAEVPARRP